LIAFPIRVKISSASVLDFACQNPAIPHIPTHSSYCCPASLESRNSKAWIMHS